MSQIEYNEEFSLTDDSWKLLQVQVEAIKGKTLKSVLNILMNSDEYFEKKVYESDLKSLNTWDEKKKSDSLLQEEEVKNHIDIISKSFKAKTQYCLENGDKDEWKKDAKIMRRIFSTVFDEWSKKLLPKFHEKYTRYFPMYVEASIADIKERILKRNKQTLTEEDLKNDLRTTQEKFNSILYIFSDNLNPQEFEIVFSWSDTKISKLKDSFDNTYETFSEYPDLLEMYKHSIAKWIRKWSNDIDHDLIWDFIEPHIKESFGGLFNEFSEWYVFWKDPKVLANIQEEWVKMMHHLQLLKKSKTCFINEQFDDINDGFVDNAFKLLLAEFKINDVQKIWKFRELIELWINTNQYSQENYIKSIQEEKNYKRKEIIERGFTWLKKIKWAGDITPESRNWLDYNERKLVFSKYIFGEKDWKLFIDDKVPTKNIENNNNFKDFIVKTYWYKLDEGETYEDIYRQKLITDNIEKFNLIMDELSEYESMEAFLLNTWDHVEMITDWYVYSLYNDWTNVIPELTESIENNILRKISDDEDLKNVEVYIENWLRNDSSLDAQTSLDLWKKRFTHLPVDITEERFGYESQKNKSEDSEGNNTLMFKDEVNLYIPAVWSWEAVDWEKIEWWLRDGIECCNLVLQNRSLWSEEWKYMKVLLDQGFDIYDKNLISNLRVFLKFCLHSNEKLMKMFDSSYNVNKLMWRYFWWKNKKNYIEAMWFTGEDYKRWEQKEYFWAFEKLIKRKKWNLKAITDLSRKLNVFDTFTDAEDWVLNFVKYLNKVHDGWVEAVSIDQYTWNYMRKWPKDTWYRDINLLVKLAGEKNPIEVQFHYRPTLEWKQYWINFSELVNLYQADGIFFTQEEVDELSEFAYVKKMKLPADFQLICEENVKIPESVIKKTNFKVNADYMYNLSWKNKDVYSDVEKKFQWMEYIPFANSIWKVRAAEHAKYSKYELEKLPA